MSTKRIYISGRCCGSIDLESSSGKIYLGRYLATGHAIVSETDDQITLGAADRQPVREMKGVNQKPDLLAALRRVNATSEVITPSLQAQVADLATKLTEMKRERAVKELQAVSPDQELDDPEAVTALLGEKDECLYEYTPTPTNGLNRTHYQLKSGRRVVETVARDMINNGKLELLGSKFNDSLKTYGLATPKPPQPSSKVAEMKPNPYGYDEKTHRYNDDTVKRWAESVG